MCLQMRYPRTLLSVLRWRKARWWEARWRETRWRETRWSLLLPALLQLLWLPMVLLLLLLPHFMLLLQAAYLWSRAWRLVGLLVEEELCFIVSRGKGTGLRAEMLSM